MKRWIKPIAVVLGFAAFTVLIMFGAPFVAFGTAQPFNPLWVRLTIVGVVGLIILAVWLIGFLKRRKAQAQMEEALTEAEGDSGDGEVLKEKIKEAVSVLNPQARAARSFMIYPGTSSSARQARGRPPRF